MKPFLELTLKKDTEYPICLLCTEDGEKHEAEVKLLALQLLFKPRLFTLPSTATILAFIFLSSCWQLRGGFVHLPWRFHFPGNGNKKDSAVIETKKMYMLFFQSRFHMQQKWNQLQLCRNVRKLTFSPRDFQKKNSWNTYYIFLILTTAESQQKSFRE